MSTFAAHILSYSYSLSLPPSFSSPLSISLATTHTHTQAVIRPFVIIIFVCNSETRLLMYTLSFIHFPGKSNRTESTMVKYSFIQFSLVHSLTHSFILYSSHALSVAFSFQLNNFKGLFGAFALLFSHQHALSPADESLWPLLFLHCFIVLLLFLRAMSTMECLMSYMRTYNTLPLLLLYTFSGVNLHIRKCGKKRMKHIMMMMEQKKLYHFQKTAFRYK